MSLEIKQLVMYEWWINISPSSLVMFLRSPWVEMFGVWCNDKIQKCVSGFGEAAPWTEDNWLLIWDPVFPVLSWLTWRLLVWSHPLSHALEQSTLFPKSANIRWPADCSHTYSRDQEVDITHITACLPKLPRQQYRDGLWGYSMCHSCSSHHSIWEDGENETDMGTKDTLLLFLLFLKPM